MVKTYKDILKTLLETNGKNVSKDSPVLSINDVEHLMSISEKLYEKEMERIRVAEPLPWEKGSLKKVNQ